MNPDSVESLISTQYVNQLQKAVTGTSSKVFKTNGSENILPFSQVLSEVSGKANHVNDMFQAVFPANCVETKVGNCNVPSKIWERNDFPIWQYFGDNTSADCLNRWKPTGANPTGAEPYIQQGLDKINFGEMVILMPESLQKKMEADPEYAKEVLEKVQKWKTDYDRTDNAIAASLGHDATLYQMTKSYCIQLDEDGNVGDYAVIGGGMDTSQTEENSEIKEETVSHKRVSKEVKSGIVPRITEIITARETEHIDYEKISSYITGYWHKENKRYSKTERRDENEFE